MNKVFDFFRRIRPAFIWTICYVFIMWAILYWLFNFNMFSGTQWQILAHAELRGFPGFVFGILILASLPLYIATTVITIRQGAPIVKLALPKFMQPVPADKQKSADKDTASSKSENAPDNQPAVPELPAGLPPEMRPMYIRTRTGINHSMQQQTNFGISNPSAAATQTVPPTSAPDIAPDTTTAGELPMPNDFDFNAGTSDFTAPTFTPMFTDLDFDVAPDTAPNENAEISDYLTAHDIKFETENDLIITDTAVIASHTDSDFWVADEETWFASGRQKPSPIAALHNIAAQKHLPPILYLAQTNIMDIDARRAKWESDGIRVITTPDDLKQ